MNWGSIVLWGFVATATLTTVMTASQKLGLSRMDMPLLIGTMFTHDRRRAELLGAVIHFVNGWVFALVYGAIFESLGYAGAMTGAAIGLGQGLFVLATVMPLMPAFHPRMASERQGPGLERRIQPPGFLALNYGRRSPLTTLAAHIAYGAILGAFYHLA